MSRPFRVWDTENNCFWQDVNEGHVGKIEQLFIGPSGKFILRQNGINIHESVFPGRFIRQDSTGLKDYHGKEIYEGDILKWYDRTLSWYRNPDKTSYSQIIDVAVFSDGSFRTRKYRELLINLCGTKDFNFLKISEIEVIGNIYETPLEDTP